jgi:serine/threonine-protein kinase
VVGEYRVDQVIGRGGMGVVYSGSQPVIEKRVAIKVLGAQLSADPALVRRFLDEARAVNRIRHPNIIDIFSFGQLADGRQYFVMEYLEGHTLADRLQSASLPRAEMPTLLGQMCDALDAAHAEHIVHRDLKPENIWIVEPRRARPFVKLLDFGIAKLLAGAEQVTTQAGTLMGTPQYMSPEQCHGRAVDHRTDIYAMGVILYQIYTGQVPFRGETFAEVLAKQLTLVPERPSTHAELPAELDALIMRCLAKDPAERPQSARELGDELARVLFARPAPTAPMTAPMTAPSLEDVATTTTLRGSAQALPGLVPVPARARRWPWVVALAAAALVGALGAARLASHPQSEAKPTARPAPPSPPAPAPLPPPPPPEARAVPAAEPAPSTAPAADVAEKIPDPSETKRPRAANKPRGREAAKSGARMRATSSGLVTDNPFR